MGYRKEIRFEFLLEKIEISHSFNEHLEKGIDEDMWCGGNLPLNSSLISQPTGQVGRKK